MSKAHVLPTFLHHRRAAAVYKPLRRPFFAMTEEEFQQHVRQVASDRLRKARDCRRRRNSTDWALHLEATCRYRVEMSTDWTDESQER